MFGSTSVFCLHVAYASTAMYKYKYKYSYVYFDRAVSYV